MITRTQHSRREPQLTSCQRWVEREALLSSRPGLSSLAWPGIERAIEPFPDATNDPVCRP